MTLDGPTYGPNDPQPEEDARRNAALVIRAAIAWGKYMPGVFVSDFSAEHPDPYHLEIERVEDYGGEDGWIITVIPDNEPDSAE